MATEDILTAKEKLMSLFALSFKKEGLNQESKGSQRKLSQKKISYLEKKRAPNYKKTLQQSEKTFHPSPQIL